MATLARVLPLRPMCYAAVVVALLLFLFQESLVYQPTRPVHHNYDNKIGMQNPHQAGLQYKNISITTEDNVTLRGWFMYTNRPPRNDAPFDSENRPTIVFMHENAGNIGLRLELFRN